VLAILIIHVLAVALVWLCDIGPVQVFGLGVFALCAVLIFALQWLAFVPAYLRQTEKFYDLIGSLSFISAAVLAVCLAGVYDERSVLLALLIVVWAGRLGTFLVKRIHADGQDTRFDKLKPNPVLFFRTWSLQGLWVLVTAGAALAAIAGEKTVPLGWMDAPGILLWFAGFGIEVIADAQKRRFRKLNGSEAFINSGLWSRSRHPNYFGEILLWFAVALIALPALEGGQHIALLSPVFVFLLLTRVSGIPLLERKADQRWGEDAAYKTYKSKVPLLVPRFL